MAPPTPIGTFVGVPPVTGVNKSFIPVANLYDSSGTFRPRTASYKRKRGGEAGELDNLFDLSADYPPLRTPAHPTLDVGAIKELMVTAAKLCGDLKPLMENTENEIDKPTAIILKSTMALYSVVEAIVEKAIMPLCGSWPLGSSGADMPRGGRTASVSSKNPPAPPPKPTGERELREALEKADRESVIFEADLGPVPIFNRTKLSAALSAGLKKTVIEAAEKKVGDVAEAVRILDDAFSGVENVDFLGQASRKFENSRNPTDPRIGSFCSMPVKLTFTDRDSRIHFENSIRNLGGPKATQSFPKPVRTVMAEYAKNFRLSHPDMVVMVRPDTRTLQINAFIKSDGEKSWNRLPDSYPIPLGTMIQPANAAAPSVMVTSAMTGAGAEATDPTGQ